MAPVWISQAAATPAITSSAAITASNGWNMRACASRRAMQ